MSEIFEESKEKLYDLFRGKCGELLQDFVREKEKVVCSLCNEPCTDIDKLHKALIVLIEDMVLEAVNSCDEKEDIFMCGLCPFLSTEKLFKSYSKGKTAKRLAREMEKSTDRLLAIIKEDE